MIKMSLVVFQATAIVAATLLSGCAVPVKPDNLKTPESVTCIYLERPISYTGQYGWLNMVWTTRLERGAYVSERVDENGIYYRAPTGGISITGPGGTVPPGFAGATQDGGFYIPHDSGTSPHVYRYFSTASVSPEVPAEGEDCSKVGYMKDPVTSKISLVKFAVGGAAVGAAGGIIGRGVVRGSPMSYGHAAGVGAAGGLLGGLIVAAMINSDVGNVYPGFPIQDADFVKKLRDLVQKRILVRQVDASAVGDQGKEVASPSVGETTN